MENEHLDDKGLRLEKIFTLDETNKASVVMPHCLVSVDHKHRVHLISILNEDNEEMREFLCGDFLEFFDEDQEFWEDSEPGLYVADFWIHSWQDQTIDSCEWNAELVSYNIERLWTISDPIELIDRK